jgi:hypothetical protein
MDTLESVKRQGYADGLQGVKVPRQLWLSSDAFSSAYVEAWTAGALAATAPAITAVSLSQPSISARFIG